MKNSLPIISPYYVKNVKFAKRQNNDFLSVVKKRVFEEFKMRGISQYANTEMILKTLLITAAYAGCLAAIFSNYFGSLGVVLWYAALGFACSMNGLNIAHDAMHGAYFRSQRINNWLAYFFDFNSTSSFIWRISHNTYHHIYTNIPGLDNDIDKGSALRLQPTDPLLKFHYWQNWYAIPLYSLLTFNWAWISDILWCCKEFRKGAVSVKDAAIFFAFKAANLLVFVVLPICVLSVPWWVPLLGYFLLHMVAGVVSGVIFQLGHVVEGVEFISPDQEGSLPYDWALHEMLTTSNCCTKSRWVAFWVGGLNYQIEHHLFPNICHVHYLWICDIVKQTAEEYNIPYKVIPTFWGAVASHLRALKKLGRKKQWP